MKKITVFGGSGFLGSHVVDRLISRGFEVNVCDQEKSNYLNENQNFKKCNILNLDEVRNCVEGSDIVYNFAALADLKPNSRAISARVGGIPVFNIVFLISSSTSSCLAVSGRITSLFFYTVIFIIYCYI